MKKIFLILSLALISVVSFADEHVHGEGCSHGHKHSHEEVKPVKKEHSHEGHSHDEHEGVEYDEELEWFLDTLGIHMEGELEEVNVGGVRSTVDSKMTVGQVQKITVGELCRAACCNLSESFETNASVDVNSTDAATGAKQIKLLGLSGTYVQMLTENMPNFSGLATLYGLSYVPGTWLDAISISKGTSSVSSGAEGIAGQISIDYKKPQTAPKFSVNFMANTSSRMELNLDAAWKINDHLSTMVLAHVANETIKKEDSNKDTFLDGPLMEEYHLMNRWNYDSHEYKGQWGVNALYEKRTAGQLSEIPNRYGIGIDAARVEAFSKNAWETDHEKEGSLAFVFQGIYHKHDSFYGKKTYNAQQGNLYGNLIYLSNLTEDSHMHNMKAGVGATADWLNEIILGNLVKTTNIVPGAFVEYTLNVEDKYVLLAGFRADYSTKFGFYYTPRLHFKYMPIEELVVRVSAGKGYRTPYIYAENNNLMASSREFVVADDLRLEDAWNTGISIQGDIPIGNRTLSLKGDYYYTHFMNQIVADMDADPHKVLFYNSNGALNYSHNAQIEATMEAFTGFTITAAYKYSNVMNTTGGVLREKALLSAHKGLVTASYKTQKYDWQFDFTWQINGGGRMPLADEENPLWENYYEPHHMLLAQITKNIKNWSIYAGAENMTNHTQKNPIISASDPWSNDFDATMIYAPVSGWKVYLGITYTLD